MRALPSARKQQERAANGAALLIPYQFTWERRLSIRRSTVRVPGQPPEPKAREPTSGERSAADWIGKAHSAAGRSPAVRADPRVPGAARAGSAAARVACPAAGPDLRGPAAARHWRESRGSAVHSGSCRPGCSGSMTFPLLRKQPWTPPRQRRRWRRCSRRRTSRRDDPCCRDPG